jgi:hypothetical protein
MNVRTRLGAIAAAFWIASSSMGCGYQFAGTGNRLPPDVKTVAFGPIQNRTKEIGLDRQLIEAITDEIASHGRLEVGTTTDADVILSGSVRDYVNRPISFTKRDEALEYRATVSTDLELRRRDNGKLLWKSVNLQESEEYGAVPGVVVTSSSQFQKSTINAGDIGLFTDISVAEGQRREANERLVETLSRSIYNQMMEDF